MVTVTWTGRGNPDDVNDPANWNPHPPLDGDDVMIPAGSVVPGGGKLPSLGRLSIGWADDPAIDEKTQVGARGPIVIAELTEKGR